MTKNPNSPKSMEAFKPELEVQKFLEALSNHDPTQRSKAKEFLKVGFEGDNPSSPRVKNEIGEWDDENVVLLMVSVECAKTMCGVRVLSQSASSSSSVKFCGAESTGLDGTCTAKSHTGDKKVTLPGPGFYISTSANPTQHSPRSGVHLHPYLPFGPPLTPSAVVALSEPTPSKAF